jgi:ATP-dependent Clp protease ATP-binding subunit ClpA
MDVNILKPAELRQDALHGASTYEEYKNYFEKDRARRFRN